VVGGGQHLVAGQERQRPRHGVDAAGGVGQEDQVVGARAQVIGQHFPRQRQQRARAAAEEVHRIALELGLAALVVGKHLGRAGAEGAVVEEDEIGVEQEGVAHGQ